MYRCIDVHTKFAIPIYEAFTGARGLYNNNKIIITAAAAVVISPYNNYRNNGTAVAVAGHEGRRYAGGCVYRVSVFYTVARNRRVWVFLKLLYETKTPVSISSLICFFRVGIFKSNSRFLVFAIPPIVRLTSQDDQRLPVFSIYNHSFCRVTLLIIVGKCLLA